MDFANPFTGYFYSDCEKFEESGPIFEICCSIPNRRQTIKYIFKCDKIPTTMKVYPKGTI